MRIFEFSKINVFYEKLRLFFFVVEKNKNNTIRNSFRYKIVDKKIFITKLNSRGVKLIKINKPIIMAIFFILVLFMATYNIFIYHR